MEAALWELAEGDADEEVEVIIRLHQPHVAPPGIHIVTQFGSVVTCRLRRSRILEVRRDERVASMKAPMVVIPGGEPAVPAEDLHEPTEESDRRRPRTEGATGRGVLVGVIDWGCDFTHPNFRSPDGRTRLLALWDQTAPYAPDRPNRYGYGAVYAAADIDLALAAERPDAALGYAWHRSDPGDSGAHGTHVLDIAAGNGRVGPAGVAPEAELVFVHLASRALPRQAGLGDSVALLEAVDFIFRTAGDRPVCINTSMGRQMGSHDGSSLVEQAFDAALTLAPGRFIGQSTGNYYDRHAHSSGQLRPGQVLTIPFVVGEADVTPNELEVWYPGRDVLGVQVRTPTGVLSRKTGPEDEASIRLGEREVCRIYHRAREPNNLDNTIHVYVYTGAPGGTWELVLTGDDVVDGRFNAWIERDAACHDCQARFEVRMAVPLSTTGSIANGFRPVAVGAYDAHDPERRLGRFSSSGPTRDGRIKPDLVAPGVEVLAARSSPRVRGPAAEYLTRKSGTSMAAPHVTGTVALMFETAGRALHIQEVRNLLLTSARPAEVTGDAVHRVGSGYLDTDAAIAATREYVRGDRPARMEPERLPAAEQEGYPMADDEAFPTGVAAGLPEAELAETGAGGTWAEADAALDTTAAEDDELAGGYAEAPGQAEDPAWGEEAPKRSFLIVSGGPGLFDRLDKEHDIGWSNYVDPPLLKSVKTDPKTNKKMIVEFWSADEQVVWFVYRPAYEARWKDDVKQGRSSVAEVKKLGFASYVELLEKRAEERGWSLVWMKSGAELWSQIKGLRKRSISRVWYYGHARGDLWLTLDHDGSGVPREPAAAGTVVTVGDIAANSALRNRFEAAPASGSPARTHRFIGCNTAPFAKGWAKRFAQWTEGFEGTVRFQDVHTTTGHEPSLSTGCALRHYGPPRRPAAAAGEAYVAPAWSSPFGEDEAGYGVGMEREEELENEPRPFPEYAAESPDLVELAESALDEGWQRQTPRDHLERVLSQAGIAPPDGWEAPAADPSALFQAFRNGGAAAWRDRGLELVLGPGAAPSGGLQPGDVLLRRIPEDDYVHVAFLAGADVLPPDQALARGWRIESRRPGGYVRVVEAGAPAHRREARFARRVLEPGGHAPANQIVLRVRIAPGAPLPPGADEESAEAVTAAGFRLLLDSNRDGRVDRSGSGAGAWQFGATGRGAIVLVNNDDDGINGTPDNEDAAVDRGNDDAELAPLTIERTGTAAPPPGTRLELTVSDRSHIRIFAGRAAGSVEIIGPSTGASHRFASLTPRKFELGMEGVRYAGAGFNGEVEIRLRVTDPAGAATEQTAKVRVAPWMMPSHLDAAEKVYVAQHPRNAAFRAALKPLVRAAGCTLVEVPVSHGDDWMQDVMEFGFSNLPGKGFRVVTPSAQTRTLSTFPPSLLDADLGVNRVGSTAAWNTFDSHGNLEATPPATSRAGKRYPFGRIYYGPGKGLDLFDPDFRAFLHAQVVQGPFEVDTSWLAVGHVDEVISFVPAPGRKGFKLLLASPRRAYQILDGLAASHGSAKVLTGREFPVSDPSTEAFLGRFSVETTVTALLAAGAAIHPEARLWCSQFGVCATGTLRDYNTARQCDMDGIRGRFTDALGLVEADIVDIPAVFMPNPGTPSVADALIPGMANMLVLNGHCIVPKPFGPVVGGKDRFEEEVRAKLRPLGLRVAFLDCWHEYHVRLGEIHCGTNTLRTKRQAKWWEFQP